MHVYLERTADLAHVFEPGLGVASDRPIFNKTHRTDIIANFRGTHILVPAAVMERNDHRVRPRHLNLHLVSQTCGRNALRIYKRTRRRIFSRYRAAVFHAAVLFANIVQNADSRRILGNFGGVVANLYAIFSKQRFINFCARH